MTSQDRIRELEKEVAALVERLNYVRMDIARIEKFSEDRDKRRWSFMVALFGVIAAILGSVATKIFKAIWTYWSSRR